MYKIKSIIKIASSIFVIFLTTYFLYASYSSFFNKAFQKQDGIAKMIYIFEFYILLFLLMGTIYYLKLVHSLVSFSISEYKTILNNENHKLLTEKIKIEIPNHIKYISTFFAILLGFLGGLLSTKIILSIDILEPISLLFSIRTNPLIAVVFLLSFFAIGYICLFIFSYIIYATNKYNI